MHSSMEPAKTKFQKRTRERRPRHSGALQQIAPGLFLLRWDCGFRTDKHGNVVRKQKSERFEGTRAEAQAYLASMKRSADIHASVDDQKITVAEHIQNWITFRQKGPKPAQGYTLARYRLILKNQIVPKIGNIRLRDLTSKHLDNLYAHLHKEGAVDGSPLSWTTVTQCHRIIHASLQQAVALKLIANNPAAAVLAKPQPERPEIPTFERETLLHLIEHTRGTPCTFEGCDDDRIPKQLTKDGRFHIPIILGGLCGLRRGEILDLQWGDIDLDRKRLSVRRALEQSKPDEDRKTVIKSNKPKSGKERAVAFGQETADALRRAKRIQANRLGSHAVANDQRVVTQLDGSIWLPCTFTHDFSMLLSRMGIRGHYHMTRHTAATNMLRTGTPAKVVQHQLGHASAAFTLDRYGHVDASMQAEAAEKLDALLFRRQQSPEKAQSL